MNIKIRKNQLENKLESLDKRLFERPLTAEERWEVCSKIAKCKERLREIEFLLGDKGEDILT